MARKQSDYDSHQAVKSFWFSGSPLRQLSPEAITELCFRFSNHFPHSNNARTIRGICTTISELDKTTLALLAGLKFSCVEIDVDASIASNDRSLSKIETGLQMISDYEQLGLNFKIKFSHHCHPDFLKRLLTVLKSTSCQHIKLICPYSPQTEATCETDIAKNHLLEINDYFYDIGWLGCGNNFFYGPQHENYDLYRQKKLRLTPWGYHHQTFQTQLGVGVGALSMAGDTYELTTVDSNTYQQCINNKKALPTTRYGLPPGYGNLIDKVQELICYHEVQVNPDDLEKLFSPLIQRGWLIATTETAKLTSEGLVNLNTLANFLFSQINNEGYNSVENQHR